MSFISKLSQFTEGFASGAPLGAQIGGTLAAHKTRVANQDEKKIQTMFDAGARAAAVQEARNKGLDNLAQRLSMQLTAEDRSELQNIAGQVQSTTAGLSTQVSGADLTTEVGRGAARDVLSRGATSLSAGAEGLRTRQEQLGYTGDVTDEALATSSGFIAQAGTQIQGIDNLDTEIQGLMSNLTASSEEIEAQLDRIELAYKQAGGIEEDFSMMEDRLKRGIQSARDNVFTQTILPNIQDATFLRKLAIDYSVSPGIDAMAENVAKTIELENAENVSERERYAALEARNFISLAQTVGQNDPSAGLDYLELAAQTYESDPLNNLAMAESIRKNKHAFIRSYTSMDKSEWTKWAFRQLVTDPTVFHKMLGKRKADGSIDFTQDVTVEELHTLANTLFKTPEDVNAEGNEVTALAQDMATELSRVADTNDEEGMKNISIILKEELDKTPGIRNTILQTLSTLGWIFDDERGVFVPTDPLITGIVPGSSNYTRRPPPVAATAATAVADTTASPTAGETIRKIKPTDPGQRWNPYMAPPDTTEDVPFLPRNQRAPSRNRTSMGYNRRGN